MLIKGKNASVSKTSPLAWPLPTHTRPLPPAWPSFSQLIVRQASTLWWERPSFHHVLQIIPTCGFAPSLLICDELSVAPSLTPDRWPSLGVEGWMGGWIDGGYWPDPMFQTRETFFTAKLSRAYLLSQDMRGSLQLPTASKVADERESFQQNLTSPHPKEEPFNQVGPDGTTTWKCHKFKGRHQSMLP